MGEKETIIRGIRKFKKELSKERKINKIIFFGSRVVGKESKYSDIDLIIVSPSFEGVNCSRGTGLHKYWHLDYPVDFLCYTPAEFNILKKKISIVSEAVKRGIAI